MSQGHGIICQKSQGEMEGWRNSGADEERTKRKKGKPATETIYKCVIIHSFREYLYCFVSNVSNFVIFLPQLPTPRLYDYTIFVTFHLQKTHSFLP